MKTSSISLDDILRNKRNEVEQSKKIQPLPELQKTVARNQFPLRSFRKALLNHRFTIIAEIKRKSPSHGDLENKKMVDVKQIAGAYDAAEDVSCISVLTDSKHFGCDISDMRTVRSITHKPILRKDFIVDEYQIYEARAYGADAVLLITRILQQDEIRRFVQITRSLGMEPFVECHEKHDFEKVPSSVSVIGINTRDLGAADLTKAGTTDLDVVRKGLEYITPEKIIVAESGVRTPEDILTIYNLVRVSAVLIGAYIIEHSDNVQNAINDLLISIPVHKRRTAPYKETNEKKWTLSESALDGTRGASVLA